MPNIVYAGSGELGAAIFSAGNRKYYFYKTVDGGKRWKEVSPELFGIITSFALAKSDIPVIYLIAAKGEEKLHYTSDSHLWKNIDSGKTWEKIDEQQTQFVMVHPKDKDVVYRALYARDIRDEDTGFFHSKKTVGRHGKR